LAVSGSVASGFRSRWLYEETEKWLSAVFGLVPMTKPFSDFLEIQCRNSSQKVV